MKVRFLPRRVTGEQLKATAWLRGRRSVSARAEGFLSEMEDCAIEVGDHGSKTGGHLGRIREFIRCVKEGGAPETSAEDNIGSLAMVFGATESAGTERKLDIEIGRNRNP